MLLQTSTAAAEPRGEKRKTEVEVDGKDQLAVGAAACGALPAGGGTPRRRRRRRLSNSGIGLSAGSLQVRK